MLNPTNNTNLEKIIQIHIETCNQVTLGFKGEKKVINLTPHV